jgi:F-type H+-transporting ATPase subunit epsilon
MRLNVYSLKGPIYQGEIKSVNAKTQAGEITVLDHHRPLISLLKKGDIKIMADNGQQKDIVVDGGFLEVRPGNITNILVN